MLFYKDILQFTELPSYGNYHPVQRGSVTIGIGAGAGVPERHYFRPEIVADIRKGLGVKFVLEVDDREKEYEMVKKTEYPTAEELKKQG